LAIFQRRGKLAPLNRPSHICQQGQSSVQKLAVELHRHPFLGSNIVDHPLIAGKAVLPQGKALGSQLDQMGLEDPWPCLAFSCLPALVFHWRDLTAISLQKVYPAAYSCLRGGEGDGSSMKGLKVLRDWILLGIYPAVKMSAFNSLSAILEFPLNPLKIAEPGAIGIGGEHAGGDEVRSCRGALTLFFDYQLQKPPGWQGGEHH
jgi:hypothetical protein